VAVEVYTMNVQQFKIEHTFKHLKNIDIREICKCKSILLERNLIGKLTEKEPVKEFIGYDCGNISIKLQDNPLQILITGSQTSSKTQATLDDFSLVYSYDPQKFSVRSEGTSKPSSETPLHWSAYQANPDINAIIHAHIFNYDPLRQNVEKFFMKNSMPLTHSPSKYSSAIGSEITKIIKEGGYENIVGMLNHDGGFGLISMGKNLGDACKKLIKFHDNLKESVL
jgi:L-ribulose-5-phosphate 4-epimerase